ncbi:dTMP kinase [bacterium]|nr:dTMP kinase [bacterium]MCK4437191.1 dTMP kinase [bacterium]
MKGIFITLEGPEGSGKSTQAERLSDYLLRKGIDVLCTHEPGGTRIGERLRKILLSPRSKGMTPLTELLLYLASRAQHVEEVVKPSLARGKVAVSTRFSDSSLAYQGYGRGLNKQLIRKMNQVATAGLKPDLTILLDIDIPQGLKRARAGSKGDRLEREKREFHQRVRQGYLKLAKQEPKRIKIVKVKGSIAEVQKRIRQQVEELLKKAGYRL